MTILVPKNVTHLMRKIVFIFDNDALFKDMKRTSCLIVTIFVNSISPLNVFHFTCPKKYFAAPYLDSIVPWTSSEKSPKKFVGVSVAFFCNLLLPSAKSKGLFLEKLLHVQTVTSLRVP